MSRYNDLIKTLPNINLDIISKICYELVPKQFRDCPWKIAYGDKNFGKIFTTEDELNAYATAYTDWHKGKLERTFDNTPREAFSGDISVIDWGCGQGLATLYLYEYLIEKGINGQIKEVILIEPSKKALARAKFNIGLVNSNIDIITVNKQLNDILDKDILLSEKRKTIHLFSNILDIKDISLKQISERLKINLSKDNYILCVSPAYSQMGRVFDSFLQYFKNPLPWKYREIQSNKNILGYTYYIQSLKLLAEKEGQIIHYNYFPATQFRACYVLDCLKETVKDELLSHSYFDVYAPYEFGASISDDINPILAVLNNIICRGLPTKSSLYIEKELSEKLRCSEEYRLYGGISYRSLLNYNTEEDIKEYALNNKLGSDKRINQLLYIPIAVSRIQKLLIEALISQRLNLHQDEWNILIEEKDIPFAALAINDFKEMYNNLVLLSQDFSDLLLPKINLTVISNKDYATSPFLDDKAIFESNDEIRNIKYDLVIQYSSTPQKDECNFTEYKVYNECFFCVFPAKEFYAQRYIYTTNRLNYNPLCIRESQGVYILNDDQVAHIRYFLKLLFRKEDFRPGQLPILSRAIQNQSVIGLLPTGGGKSLTYQLAAFLQPGISLIIDPLVSLMKDQYDGLINAGIDCCTYINSQVADTRIQREFDMEHSKCLFVFLSPERLCMHNFRQRLRNMQDLNVYFAYGVIDETHCVSEWGHDFRFSYLHLGRNLYQYVLPKQITGNEHISLFGLTATASFDVLADVERELSGEGAFPIDNDAIIRYENTNRLELQYRVVAIDGSNCIDKWDVYQHKNDIAASILESSYDCLKELQKPKNLQYIKDRFLQRENIIDNETIKDITERNITVSVDSSWISQNNNDASAIVFCPHRQGSLGVNSSGNKRGIKDAIQEEFSTNNISYYTGGDLLTEQDRFLRGDTNIMVATKAFGMGIDKANVRFTLNINHSGSLEGYVQEAGRAGRDRKIALSTIMYCPKVFSEQNERTRLYENIPVDYGIHQYFYNDNFIGPDFEKWVMYFLMSKNKLIAIETNKATNDTENIAGFLDRLMNAKPGDELIYYISYKYTAESLRWINDNLTKHNLPRFRTNEDDIIEIQNKKKFGNKRPAYNYGYAGYTEALQKAIYRMCCIGVIDDFTQDYSHEQFRIVTKRKVDGEYFKALKLFLKRYYTDERADIELIKAYGAKGDNEIHKCLSFITEFVYTKIAMKRKRAIQDMEDFCNQAIHSDKKNWLEINEDLKDHIYYYFNSKYAREGYITEFGESFSLTSDTDHGKRSSFDILFKYIRVVDDNVMALTDSQIGNIKHLHGAVRLIRRSLTDTNPALDMLNAYCLLFLGASNNKNLRDEMRSSYINAYQEFRLRSNNNLDYFYSNILRFKHEIQKDGRNVINNHDMSIINEWDAQAELIIHSAWVSDFRNKFTLNKKNI